MIELKEEEKEQATALANQLKGVVRQLNSKFSGELLNQLNYIRLKAEGFINEVLERIYGKDKIVAGLNYLPELKRLIKYVAKISDKESAKYLGSAIVGNYINEYTPFTYEGANQSIEYLNRFDYYYDQAKKTKFVVYDNIKFYVFCKCAAELLGRTPQETEADFFLQRINKDAKFDLRGFPPPTREKLLEYCVECAKNGEYPFDKLPLSYKTYLSRIIAKEEKMTFNDWFETKIIPFAKGKNVELLYMISSNKEVVSSFAKRNKVGEDYSDRVNNYLKWNNLPSYFKRVFPRSNEISEHFIEPLSKPDGYIQFEYGTSVIKYESIEFQFNDTIIKCLSRLNPRNDFLFDHKKLEAALLDAKLFIGDSYNLTHPSDEMKFFIKLIYDNIEEEIRDSVYKAIEGNGKHWLASDKFDIKEFIEEDGNDKGEQINKAIQRVIISSIHKVIQEDLMESICDLLKDNRKKGFLSTKFDLENIVIKKDDELKPIIISLKESIVNSTAKTISSAKKKGSLSEDFDSEKFLSQLDVKLDDILKSVYREIEKDIIRSVYAGIEEDKKNKIIVGKLDLGKFLSNFDNNDVIDKRNAFLTEQEDLKKLTLEEKVLRYLNEKYSNKILSSDIRKKYLWNKISKLAQIQGMSEEEYLAKNGFILRKNIEVELDELTSNLIQRYPDQIIDKIDFMQTEDFEILKHLSKVLKKSLRLVLQDIGFSYAEERSVDKKEKKTKEEKWIERLSKEYPDYIIKKLPAIYRNALSYYVKKQKTKLYDYLKKYGFNYVGTRRKKWQETDIQEGNIEENDDDNQKE